MHLSELKKDNDILQVNLDNSEVKIRFLEDEVVAIKKQMGDEIARVNAQVIQIQKEQQPTVELTALQAQIQALKEENEALRQANVDVQRSTQKLKELNDHLIQKADFLQYELTKTRAQATGWERISGNYKLQIEKTGAASGAVAGNRLPLNSVS